MSDLLNLVLEAHGGLKRWNELTRFEGNMSVRGALWARKGWAADVLGDVDVSGLCHEQVISYKPFTEKNKRSKYTPLHVAIVDDNDHVLAQRDNPRDSVKDHGPTTPWDDLQWAYFSGYAMWNYVAAPFMLASEGVETEEIEPWDENGEIWRRLQARFPSHLHTHCEVQTFHIDRDGLLRRMDYVAPVTGSTATAFHYMSKHRRFDGIVVPTERRAFAILPDGSMMKTPGVLIDISDMSFE
jgi:hypothetical protein